MKSNQKSGWHYLARLRKGDCYLAKGDLVAAESLYNLADAHLLPSHDHEYLLWIRAQVKFFSHEFDDAKKLYADLTVKFRKGMSVNNCLRKMLMITENTGFDRYDLGLLADAEYLMVRSEYDSAETKLVSLSEKSGSNLADISTYTLGELYLLLGEPDKAGPETDSGHLPRPRRTSKRTECVPGTTDRFRQCAAARARTRET
jgi:predicted negative regulator of RcsB-dependent stress response